MAKFSQARIKAYLADMDNAQTNAEKGRALEDLVCYLFGKVPGITITRRNELNEFEAEEIDVAFWNNPNEKGFYFLPNIVLVECKNWSGAVGSDEVAWFDTKLRARGQSFGVLVAARGVTGDAASRTAAHQIVSRALSEDRKLIVMTMEEIVSLEDTTTFVKLLQEKLTSLVVTGTALP